MDLSSVVNFEFSEKEKEMFQAEFKISLDYFKNKYYTDYLYMAHIVEDVDEIYRYVMMSSIVQEVLSCSQEGLDVDFPVLTEEKPEIPEVETTFYSSTKDYNIRKDNRDKSFSDILAHKMSRDVCVSTVQGLEAAGMMYNKKVDFLTVEETGLKGALDPRPFERPIRLQGETGVSADLKRVQYDLMRSFKSRYIVSFWAERGSGIVKYSKNARKVIVLSTIDYPVADRVEYYSKYLKGNKKKKVFVHTFPCLLADLTVDMVENYLESIKLPLQRTCYFSHFVPQAAKFSSLFPNSALLFVDKDNVQADEEMSIPQRLYNIDVDSAVLGDWHSTNFPSKTRTALVHSVYDKKAGDLLSFYQHRVFRDKVVYSQAVEDIVPHSVTFTMREWTRGTCSTKESQSWSINVRTFPETVEEANYDDIIGAGSLIVPSSRMCRSDTIPLCQIDSMFVTSYKQDDMTFPTSMTTYYFTEVDGNKVFIDYDSVETFSQRRFRMISAGLTVCALNQDSSPKFYVVFPGQKNLFLTFYVNLDNDQEDYLEDIETPVIKGVAYNKDLMTLVRDPAGVISLTYCDAHKEYVDIKAYFTLSASTHRQSSPEEYIYLDGISTALFTISSSTEVFHIILFLIVYRESLGNQISFCWRLKGFFILIIVFYLFRFQIRIDRWRIMIRKWNILLFILFQMECCLLLKRKLTC
jgi:hypothetical protein